MWSLCACLLSGCNGRSAHKEDDHDHEQEEQKSEHKEGEAEKHSDEIIFPKAKADAAGVKVEVVKPGNFCQVIKTSGQVLSAQGDEAAVVATASGIVSFRTLLTEGAQVRKGAPLLTISSKEIIDGDPIQKARVSYQIAKQEYDRSKELLKSKIVSEREFNQVRENYESARLTFEAMNKNHSANGQSVNSPMSGFVKNCLVKEGDYVSVGQQIAMVTQNKRLFLRAEVSEKHYTALKTISSANFKTPYDEKVYGLNNLNGRLVSFGKASDATSFYIPVTFEFDNKGEVVPGAFVEVYLLSSPKPNVLSIPRSALTEEGGLFFVYLQLDEEGYKKQEVKVGADDGKSVEILSGIKPGDRVVTNGAYQVKLASASSAIPAHSHEH